MNNTEVFLPIPGYEENYLVSNKGTIFGIVNSKNLKPHKNKSNGIWSVKLSLHGKSKTWNVAKLVLMAFVKNPNPNIYNVAIPLDGNSDNHTLDNLIWATISVSSIKKWERNPNLIERLNYKKGKATNQKMTLAQIEELIILRGQGIAYSELIKKFPIGKTQIANILKKRAITL